MVVHAQDANEQHYEVPAEFFQRVLGPHLKYSCGYWPDPQMTLADAEAAMLRLTVERAELDDGMQILELGCGWGSLSLWMAEQLPQCAGSPPFPTRAAKRPTSTSRPSVGG